MNTNKKILYTMICALALQAVVPAQASIWSSIARCWNNAHIPAMSQRMRTAGRTAGMIAFVGAVSWLAIDLGFDAYAWYKKKKKSVDGALAPIESKPVVSEADIQFLPVIANPTQQELQSVKDASSQRACIEPTAFAVQHQAALAQLNEQKKKTEAQEVAVRAHEIAQLMSPACFV